MVLLLLFASIGCAQQQSAAAANPSLEPPPAPREFRGVWVATVGNIDWPSKPGLSTQEQQAEALHILDRAAELHMNAVVFQVRPACDAMYDSKIEPWSFFLTGKQGQPPSPYYDPLKFWIAEAHKRGLELHAWFNPYRAHLAGEKTPIAANHVSKTKPGIVKQYGEFQWLDPGEKAAQDQTYNVVMDIARRYDVDGMHIDDYFYPYKVKKYPKDRTSKEILEFPDNDSWNRYKRSGGKLDHTDIFADYYATTQPDDRKVRDPDQIARDNWRRENVNSLIHRIYDGLKKEKRQVRFGIAPFGLQRKGLRPPIAKGFDPYEELYADADMWFQRGWCDYFAPQLYWKTTAATQPYQPLLEWWVKENAHKRNLYVGNFTGRVGEPPATEEGDDSAATTQPSNARGGGGRGANRGGRTAPTTQGDVARERDRERRRRERSWDAQELLNQIRITRETPGAQGNIHFSAKVFDRDPDGLNEKLKTGPYREQALPPASPWLDDKAPDAPNVDVDAKKDGTIVANWKANGERPALWTLYVRRGDTWQFHVLPPQTTSTSFQPATEAGPVNAIAVAAVDEVGNESKRMVVVPGAK